MASSIALIIASHGYQSAEYQIPKRIFENAGFKVVTVSDQAGTAHANDNSTTIVDSTVDTLSVTDFKALVFIGGSGALECLDNDVSYTKIQEAVMANIVVGAICIAPRIVAKAGALVAKRANGWNNDGQLDALWQKHGVIKSDDQVVVDGLIVTATGPSVADIFAQALLKIV